MMGVCELEGGGVLGEPACLLKGEGGSPPFHLRPLWQWSIFLCNASLQTACSLCSSRSSQLLCSRRWAVFVFNFFRPHPFPDWRYRDNTRPGVHIHSTCTDERISDPCMVSEPPLSITPSPSSSWLLRIQTLSADGVWPASEVDLTAGCDARRANWPAQQHWSRIRKWKRHRSRSISES